MKLGTILYGLWAGGISTWFIYAAIMGTSPFAATTQHQRGTGIYGPTHK
ncbi:MAG: hypothetical protein AABZ45_00265 [Pseudomonadota bacterium]